MATAERFFITAGPIRREDHYHIDPLSRVDYPQIKNLIDQKKYFVLHAPRQTGKTSALFALKERLNTEGAYRALYVNVEPAQAAREDVAKGIRTILGGIRLEANLAGYEILREMIDRLGTEDPGSRADQVTPGMVDAE